MIYILLGASIGCVGFFYAYKWLCRNNFEARVAQGERRMREDSQYTAEVLRLAQRIEDGFWSVCLIAPSDARPKCGIAYWLPKMKEFGDDQ